MISALLLATAHVSKLRILFWNYVLDGNVCKNKFFYVHIFIFFWFLDTILSYTLILLISQLQTQQLMTSQFRLDIEYLEQTYNICVHIILNIGEKCSLTDGFNAI